jgi:hypothetical protein
MSLKSDLMEDAFPVFPAGNNIRITIAGLAVCKFEPDTTRNTLIHFLNHVPLHELRVTIRRKAINSTNVEIVLPETEIHRNSDIISVAGIIMGNQPNYKHPPQAREFPLDELLNISDTHRTRFTRNSARAIEMRLSHCAFYIKELTDDLYYVFADGLPTSISPKKLGKVLAAYMNVTERIFIDVDGERFFERLIEDEGVRYEYEIEFTNHCEAARPACEAVTGNLGTDVRFLYDIIRPPKNNFEKILLLRVGFPTDTNPLIITPDVAACLPGTTEPCDNCS